MGVSFLHTTPSLCLEIELLVTTKGWEDIRAGLDAMEKRNISCPRYKTNPNFSTIQPAAFHYTTDLMEYPRCIPIYIYIYKACII
jgi:hypothetical protein